MSRGGTAEYLARLSRRYGIKPRKSLGQHFMIDDDVMDTMIEAAGLGPDDTVLEIGPGPGTLTRKLVEAAGRVVAIELDPEMVEILRKELGDRDDLEIIHGNFAELGIPNNVNKLVSNIPYQISSVVVSEIAKSDLDVAVITVQREFADRMTAEPGTKDYGRLTVLVSLTCDVEVVRGVPPRSFVPPPRVSSAVVKLVPNPSEDVLEVGVGTLEKVCAGVFPYRRKTLRNALRNWASREGLDEDEILEVAPSELLDKRPMHMTPEEVLELSKALKDVLS